MNDKNRPVWGPHSSLFPVLALTCVLVAACQTDDEALSPASAVGAPKALDAEVGVRSSEALGGDARPEIVPWFIDDTKKPAEGSSLLPSALPRAAPRLVVHKRDGALDPMAEAHGAALLARASVEPTRVIVGLRAPFEAEGRMPSAASVRLQRQEIASVAERLRERMRGMAAHQVRDLFPLPYVVVVAGGDALRDMLANPDVVSIAEDGLSRPLLAQSGPLIGADEAHALDATGDGVAVAILDTGVQLTHSHFTGRIVSEACYSSNVPSHNATSLCPGGVTSSTEPGSGDDCSSSISGCGHGTAVAGIAAGGDSTYTGVAPAADIIAIKVFSRFDDPEVCGNSNPCVRGYDSDWVAGLNRVAELRGTFTIAAANMSLGGGEFSSACDWYSPSGKTAIDNLRSHGIATIVASGNDGYSDAIAAPACISSAISVGSTNKQDGVSYFSNSASILDLLAPGESIRTASLGGGTATGSGTSFAAPQVAGAWAAIRSLVPQAHVTEVFQALVETGVEVNDSRNSIERPRIQVDEALLALGGAAVLPPVMEPPGGAFNEPASVTLTSHTEGALIAYTIDGSEPGPTHGTTVANGSTVVLDRSGVLRSVAYTSLDDYSTVSSGDYFVRARLRVSLEPAEAISSGAGWRLAGPLDEGFESGALDRFGWSRSGSGEWTVEPLAMPGEYMARSPVGLGHHNSASLAVEVESDGGDISFVAAVSSEEGYDELCFFIDDAEQDCWSGEIAWTERSFPVGPGPRTFRWTYSKDQSISEGLDAAFLAMVRFPGDEWRDTGEVLDWLPAIEDLEALTVVFEPVPMWDSPAARDISLDAGELKAITGVYVPRETAPPVFEPDPDQVFTAPIEVSMTTETPSASIRYTLDGTEPSESSLLFSAPIPLSADSDTTIRARAYADDRMPSDERLASYTIGDVVAEPVILPSSGIFHSPQQITIISPTAGARIRYTLDESEPGPESSVYDSPIAVPLESTVTVRARGYKESWAPSRIAQETITVTGTVDAPLILPGTGIYQSPREITMASATPGAIIRYTLDGSEPGPQSYLFEAPIPVPLDSTVSVRARAYKDDWAPSAVSEVTVTVTGAVEAPAFSLPPGVYSSAQDVAMTTSTAFATIRYTLDGGEPTASSPVYDGPVQLEQGSETRIRARAFREHWTPSTIVEGVFRITGKVAEPVFGLSSDEVYTEEQRVPIDSPTPGAVIRYTIDGTTPTEGSTVYAEPIAVPIGGTLHLCAAAFLDGWDPSDAVCEIFRVLDRLEPPVFSLEPGVYHEEASVTLVAEPDAAVVRFTLDGTKPDEDSAFYSEPIPLDWNETTELRAVASLDGWVDSTVASATYHLYEPLRVVDDSGQPLERVTVPAGTSVEFEVLGGPGRPSATVRGPSGRALGEVEPTDDTAFIYHAPSEGAFAGSREIIVEDSVGLSAGFEVDVPLVVELDRDELRAMESLEITVRGGERGTVHALEIVDSECEPLAKAGALIMRHSSEDEPEEGNPARAAFHAAKVQEEIVFRVEASAADTFGTSEPARVVPVDPEDDEPLPPAGHVAPADTGCGCSSSSGTGSMPALLALSMIALMVLRRGRVVASR